MLTLKHSEPFFSNLLARPLYRALNISSNSFA